MLIDPYNTVAVHRTFTILFIFSGFVVVDNKSDAVAADGENDEGDMTAVENALDD